MSAGILAIDHVQLAMPAGREAEARVYYGEILGFGEVEKPAGLAGRGGAWFEKNGIRVHLGVDPDFQAARKAHIGFVVADLPALERALRGAGVDVVPDGAIDGTRRFFAHDPFGNRLEFMEGSH